MTTVSSPPSPPSAANLIFQDTQAIRQDVATMLELARATALPLPGEKVSVLETMVKLLQMIVAGVEQNRQAIEALHQKLDEPAIAQVLRRMLDAD